jgi:hypothetical protein
MGQQRDSKAKQIKLADAIDRFRKAKEGLNAIPDDGEPLRAELRREFGNKLQSMTESGVDIAFGNYYVEVYESDDEYYVDEAGFQYVMEQIQKETDDS